MPIASFHMGPLLHKVYTNLHGGQVLHFMWSYDSGGCVLYRVPGCICCWYITQFRATTACTSSNLEHVPNFPAGLAGSAPCKEEATWPQDCMSAAG